MVIVKEGIKMKRLKDVVLKIDKDFMNYAGFDDVKEWNTLNDYFIYHLEHELELYEEKNPIGSWVTKDNVRKVKRVIVNYYNKKYIVE